MDLITLKASAYDILAQIEYLQKKLQEINQVIGEKIKEEQETPKVDG